MQSTKPKNLFVQKHFHTFHNADGSKNFALERAFAELESATDPVIEQIVSFVRNRSKPALSHYDKAIWDNFFYAQWRRVPDAIDEHMKSSEVEKSIFETVQEYEETVRPLTEAEREYLMSDEGLARLRQNAKVIALASPGEKVLEALEAKGLGIAYITNPKKSFILGSYPVAKLTLPGRANLSDPSVEAWLPISRDIAITPAPEKNTIQVVHVSDERHIRRINLAIASQSNIIASSSRQLVSSLAAPR